MFGNKSSKYRILIVAIGFLFFIAVAFAQDGIVGFPVPGDPLAMPELKDKKEPWQPDPKDFKVGEEYAAMKKAMKHPELQDLLRQKMELMDWQWQYYERSLKALEYEYSARCYKDPRYVRASHRLDELRREARRLLLLGRMGK
jgi:hypothetical protein